MGPPYILVPFNIVFISGDQCKDFLPGKSLVQCLFYQKPIISYHENADLQQPCLHNLNIISSAAILQQPFPRGNSISW